MSLSESDKNEIKKLIAEALAEKSRPPEDASEIDWDNWREDGIISKSTGLIIAPEDYTEGGKDLFTWEEAMGIEKTAPDGWRLPTIAEWVQIVAEFGAQESGELDASLLKDKLGLETRGWVGLDGSSPVDQGVNGDYWSRTSHSSNTDVSWGLDFNASNSYFRLQNYYVKYYSFAVRCVLDKKEGKR